MLEQENDDNSPVERTDDVYWDSVLPPRATTSRRQSYYPSGTYPEAKSDLSSPVNSTTSTNRLSSESELHRPPQLYLKKMRRIMI